MDAATRRAAMRMLHSRKWRVKRNCSEKYGYVWSLYAPGNSWSISSAQSFDEAQIKFPRVARNYIDRRYTRPMKTLWS